jgi:hypothetical protein
MFDGITHIPKGTESIALTEIRRVLNSGGVLALSTPLEDLRSNLLDAAWYFQ